MRYRLMASYQGSPFEAGIGPTDSDIVLFAACPPPEELGFEPATGHWRKQLRIEDVQAVWESRPVGMFRGERCMVLDDLGDRLHIGYLGHDAYQAEQLGYWQVDRGVFELVAPRTEVSEILEERSDYPPAPGSGLASGEPEPGLGYPHSGLQPILPAEPNRPVEQIPSGLSGQRAMPWAYHAQAPAGEPLAYPPPTSPDLYEEGPAAPEGPYSGASSYSSVDMSPTTDLLGSAAYLPVLDDTTGVAVPVTAEAPLPLEAEAMRAASASRRPRQSAEQRRDWLTPPDSPAQELPLAPAMQASAPVIPAPEQGMRDAAPAVPAPEQGMYEAAPAVPAPEQGMRDAAPAVPAPEQGMYEAAPAVPAPEQPVGPLPSAPQHVPPLYVVPDPVPGPALVEPAQPRAPQPAGVQSGPVQPGLAQSGLAPAGPAHSAATSRQRRAARRRMATERLFADLASQAGIPGDSYAVGEEVEGAMCLIQTDGGFEVFHSADGARHELQVFATEESACFYLFGVLAAEAVRTGSLIRLPAVRP